MDTSRTQTLSKLFDEKTVSQDDREFWLARLADIPQSVYEDIIALFRTLTPNAIKDLRTIQERKEEALASGNTQTWQEIIEHERTLLNHHL